MNTKLWRQFALVLTLIAVVSMSAYAQRGGGFGGGFGGRGGMFGGISGPAFVLRDDVQKELKLKEDQIEELRELSRGGPSMQRVMQDLGVDFRAMRDLSPEEREETMAKVQRAIAEKNKESNEEVLEVLTSTQKSRFKELKFQYDVSRGQAAAALVGADVELGDDDEQKLKEAVESANDKLNARIAELRMELYVEALGTVVSESKVKKMMGEAFVFESRSSRNPFGGGGQRGGARGGGQRGNRGGGEGGGTNPRRRRPSEDDDAEEANPRRRGN